MSCSPRTGSISRAALGNVTRHAQTHERRARGHPHALEGGDHRAVPHDARRGEFARAATSCASTRMLLDPPVFAPGDQQKPTRLSPRLSTGRRHARRRRLPAPRRIRAGAAPRRRSRPPAAAAAESVRAQLASFRLRPPQAPIARCSRAKRCRASPAKSSRATPLRSRAWMLAIYQNNPAAFDGNMNVMRSGAVLRIPDSSAVAAISPSEAGAEIRRQWAAWRGGPGAAGRARRRAGSPASRASCRAVAPLPMPSRVRRTRSCRAACASSKAQLQESSRLLELQNAELAQLQARLLVTDRRGHAAAG